MTAVLAGLACGAFVLAVVLVVAGFRWRATERRRRDERERRRIARRLDDDRARRRLRLRLQPLGPSAVVASSPARPSYRAEHDLAGGVRPDSVSAASRLGDYVLEAVAGEASS